MHAPAQVERISRTLVQAFAFMVAHPDRWVTAAELGAEVGTPKSTVYRRFGNLVAAGALRSKCVKDFRHFKLNRDWQTVPLALELHRRSQSNGVDRAVP